jgi:hypothetical protein
VRNPVKVQGITKTIKYFCCLLFFVVIPSEAFPWGQTTHAYLAKELSQGKLDSSEVDGAIYGAMLPDLFNLMMESEDYEYWVVQTHYRLTNLKKKAGKMGLDAFAFGFISHNERWGADYIAHRKKRARQQSYVLTKARSLDYQVRPQLKIILEDASIPLAFWWAGQISPDLSHTLVEVAVDLLIKRTEDPAIGLDILRSTRDRSPTIPDLLVAAYGREFARHMRISYDEASQLIRDAEVEFRNETIQVGEALALEESEAVKALAEQGTALLNGILTSAIGRDVGLTSRVLEDFINLAIREIEEDYSQEVAATLSHLEHRKSLSHYLKTILKRK